MKPISTLAFVSTLICLCVIPAVPLKASPLEDSYSIELVKTAEPSENIWEIGDRRVSGEVYTVRKGDYVYRILKDRGLADRSRLPEMLDLLKKLNPSLSNLDLIHPGQKIIIPLRIEPLESPSVEPSAPARTVSRKAPEVESLPDPSVIDAARYTVRRGDTLTRIIRDHHDIPPNVLYGRYMDMLRELNPELKDINTIRPGQVIRLPIYPLREVRKPVVRPGTEEIQKPEFPDRAGRRQLWAGIIRILTELDEECIESGAHFIPLPSGGQIDLKAETFPLVILRHGPRLVVDLYGMLPGGIRKLIEDGWDMYRVVDLAGAHSLDDAIGRVLTAAGYSGLRRAGAPLRVEGDFPVAVHGDWFFSIGRASGSSTPRSAVISLSADKATPAVVKDYLRELGVLLVEPVITKKAAPAVEGTFRIVSEPRALVAEVLDLAGRPYAGGVQIPAYQSSSAGLRLVIEADYFLQVQGRDAIIDLRGLPPEIIAFLDEHRFRVLSLSGAAGGMEVVEKVLGFIGVASGPFPGRCPEDLGSAGSVHAAVGGVCFDGGRAGTVLVTGSPVPPSLESLFTHGGVTILSIAF